MQIEGKNPSHSISPTPPPVVPPTTPPKPGDGAPHTGGEGGGVPVGLVWGGAPARRSRSRGGRGGAASPGGHPSVTSTRAGGRPKGRPAHPSVTLTRAGGLPKGRPAPQGPVRALPVSETPPSDGSPRRPTRIPRAVRLMRTISVVLGLVGVILVMTDLRTNTGMDLALSPRPPAMPCQPGSPTRMSIPALSVDAPIETIGLDRRARPDRSGQAPLGAPVDQRKAGWYAAGPKPGSGVGTVLTNGHTYRDGSAIFQEDFAALVAVGQQIDLLSSTTAPPAATGSPRYGAMSTPSTATRSWSPASACTTSRARSGSFLRRAAALGRKCPDVQGHQCRPGHPGAQTQLDAQRELN